MEYIDVLDEKGDKTGIIKSKPEVHSEGLWHKVVHVWFLNSKGEILVQHRSKEKENHPSMWDISAAGHVSSGEDSINSCLREIEEELGIIVSPDKLEYLDQIVSSSVINNGTHFDNEFQDVYIVKIDINIEQLKMQESEVDDLRWISINELKKWVEEKNPDLVSHDKEFKLLFEKILR